MKRINKVVKLIPLLSASSYAKVNLKYVNDDKILGSSISSVSAMLLYQVELRSLMPSIIGVSTNSPKFEELVRAYWETISIKIPESGRTLNIGVQFDDKLEGEHNSLNVEAKKAYTTYVSELANGLDEKAAYTQYFNNFVDIESSKLNIGIKPINPTDYLHWRFALAHNEVANLRSHAGNSARIRFTIEDPQVAKEIEKDRKLQQIKARDAAYAIVTSDDMNSIMNNILTVHNNKTFNIKDDADLRIAFDEFVISNPVKFLEYKADKNLTAKALIERLITAGLWSRNADSTAIYNANKDMVAYNTDEAIVYIKDAKNVNTVKVLKRKLADSSNL